MKTSKIYVIAAILLVAGLVLGIAGAAMCGFDFNKMKGGTDFEQREYISAGKVSEIVAEDSNAKITVKRSADDKIHVAYCENNKHTYNVTEKDGAITISQEDLTKWYDYVININIVPYFVTIELPSDYFGMLDLKTSNAKIELEEIASKNIALKTSNAQISLDGVSAETITANSSNGIISLESVEATADVSLETSNAAVSLDGVSSKSNITAKTSNARISCGEVTAKSVSLTSSNSGIEIEDTKAEVKIYADTSSGAIEIEKIDAAAINLKTSNSPITGSVSGKITDYTITSSTSNANNRLPEALEGGEKTLDIKTSNGDIDITFED